MLDTLIQLLDLFFIDNDLAVQLTISPFKEAVF